MQPQVTFGTQPLSARLETQLTASLTSNNWDNAEFAVAWVRASGLSRIEQGLHEHLMQGGRLTISTGVDLHGTSYEALLGLLELERYGNCRSYVYHNEGNAIFHPKVYLFGNTRENQLTIGSNNLTGGGVYINTEAALTVAGLEGDAVFRSARSMLESWRDESSAFVRRLTPQLVDDLLDGGYVLREQDILHHRLTSGPTGRPASRRLFGAQPRQDTPGPKLRTSGDDAAGEIEESHVSNALMMRVRRASEKERRTQVQLPFRLVDLSYFEGVTALVSAHDGRRHEINTATARGNRNTLKLEIPEIRDMKDPLMRVERSGGTLVYSVFDSDSVAGAPIRHILEAGFSTTPPLTESSIRHRARATWWRFV